MLVKNWMSKPAITINADVLPVDAINLLQKHEIHMLPVMECDRIVGMVTDQELKRATASDFTSSTSHNGVDQISQIAVSEIMTMNNESTFNFIRQVKFSSGQIQPFSHQRISLMSLQRICSRIGHPDKLVKIFPID